MLLTPYGKMWNLEECKSAFHIKQIFDISVCIIQNAKLIPFNLFHYIHLLHFCIHFHVNLIFMS